MVAPKPVSLTQVNAGDYDGAFDPEPLVVVGPIPGGAGSGVQSVIAGTNITVDSSDPQNPVVSATGGGGGGAVDSVNDQTGVVVLTLDDVVGDMGATDGLIGVVNSLTSPTETTVIQSASVTLQNTTTSRNTSLTPGDIYVSASGNRAQLTAPASGGLGTVISLPGVSGTLALAADVDNVFGIATDAEALATAAVPQTRTISGKPLSANITLDKIDVNLSNVDNTADVNKPISTATQASLDGKVPTSRTVAGKALSADVTLAKGDVGLGNVDNTSDANKPVSTATATQLNLKAPLASPAFTGTPTGITKAHVGLSNVDNTSDANKPVSTAQASAIAAKVGSPNSTITGLAYYPTTGDLPATGTAGVIYYVDQV